MLLYDQCDVGTRLSLTAPCFLSQPKFLTLSDHSRRDDFACHFSVPTLFELSPSTTLLHAEIKTLSDATAVISAKLEGPYSSVMKDGDSGVICSNSIFSGIGLVWSLGYDIAKPSQKIKI